MTDIYIATFKLVATITVISRTNSDIIKIVTCVHYKNIELVPTYTKSNLIVKKFIWVKTEDVLKTHSNNIYSKWIYSKFVQKFIRF